MNNTDGTSGLPIGWVIVIVCGLALAALILGLCSRARTKREQAERKRELAARTLREAEARVDEETQGLVARALAGDAEAISELCALDNTFHTDSPYTGCTNTFVHKKLDRLKRLGLYETFCWLVMERDDRDHIDSHRAYVAGLRFVIASEQAKTRPDLAAIITAETELATWLLASSNRRARVSLVFTAAAAPPTDDDEGSGEDGGKEIASVADIADTLPDTVAELVALWDRPDPYDLGGAQDRVAALWQQLFESKIEQLRTDAELGYDARLALVEEILAMYKQSGPKHKEHPWGCPIFHLDRAWDELIATRFVNPPLDFFADQRAYYTGRRARPVVTAAILAVRRGLGSGSIDEAVLVKIALALLDEHLDLRDRFGPDVYGELSMATLTTYTRIGGVPELPAIMAGAVAPE